MSLVETAVKYANKGLSVIPMLEKRPLISFADKPSLTESELRRIFDRYPFANIALKTDKFFVFDIDIHNEEKNGLESFKTLPREWFENTLVQKTASGGYHYFFMKPKNKNISQVINLLPGIDIKAHDNNYVLVAPSTIGDNSYKFLNKKPIAKAPDGLIDLILEKSNVNVDFNQKLNSIPIGKNKTTELFEQIANGLGVTGGRNAMLANFCGGLLFRGVDPEVVYKLAIITNDNTPDPLPPREVKTTVESMIKKEMRRRGGNE